MKCDGCCKEHGGKFYCEDCYTIQHIKLKKTFQRTVNKKFGKIRKCAKCGDSESTIKARGSKLTIHHLNPDGDRWDIDTIILLCRECHDFTDFGFVRSSTKKKVK